MSLASSYYYSSAKAGTVVLLIHFSLIYLEKLRLLYCLVFEKLYNPKAQRDFRKKPHTKHPFAHMVWLFCIFLFLLFAQFSIGNRQSVNLDL